MNNYKSVLTEQLEEDKALKNELELQLNNLCDIFETSSVRAQQFTGKSEQRRSKVPGGPSKKTFFKSNSNAKLDANTIMPEL